MCSTEAANRLVAYMTEVEIASKYTAFIHSQLNLMLSATDCQTTVAQLLSTVDISMR